MVVPLEKRQRVLHDSHCITSAGYLGVDKTYDRVAREYFWPGVYRDVSYFVRTCEICQQYKSLQQGPQGLMGKRLVERPWCVVAADMIELPRRKGQYRYVLVMQDLFTCWLELKPLRKADGKAVARALEELIFFRWETPDYLLTDNGTEFVNQVLAKTLDEYGIQHVTTPPYHPQANPVERSNRTLKTMIATYIDGSHAKQSEYYNRGKRIVEYAIGDKVMRRIHALSSAAQGFSALARGAHTGHPRRLEASLSPRHRSEEPEPRVRPHPLLPHLPTTSPRATKFLAQILRDTGNVDHELRHQILRITLEESTKPVDNSRSPPDRLNLEEKPTARV